MPSWVGTLSTSLDSAAALAAAEEFAKDYASSGQMKIDGPKRGRRVVKTGYVNRDVAEVRRLLGQVRKGGKRAQNAQRKLLERGIRYYTPEEANNLGII